MKADQELLILAIIPVLILLLYVYKKDPHKESFGSLLKIFIFGMISTIPAAILEIIVTIFVGDERLMDPISLFIYTFIGIGLIEEFVKWFSIKKGIYNTNKFDEYYDAIVYCTFVSLGFACLENILYVTNTGKSGLAVGIMRAFTSVPGHTCFGIIMGYYLCYTKFNEIRGNTEQKKYNRLSLLYPVIAHTLYDYLIMSKMVLLWLAFYIYLLIKSIKLINKVANQNQPFYFNNQLTPNETIPPLPNHQTTPTTNNITSPNNFCINCGNPINGENYCTKCGHKI